MIFLYSWRMLITFDILSEVKVAQSCLTTCDPIYYTVHGILQARILESVAFPFSRGSSQPKDQTQVSHIAGRLFTSWATMEALWYTKYYAKYWRLLYFFHGPSKNFSHNWEFVCVCLLSCVWLFVAPGTAACQTPQNFPGKSIGMGCHFLLQRIFLTRELNLRLLHLLHWQELPGRFFTTNAFWEALLGR